MMIGMFEFGAQRAAERKAVLARQHQVEQDEIDAAVGQDLAHGPAVRRRADAEALLGQRARDQIADLAMVVDDQDVRRPWHGRTIDQGRSAGLPECVFRLWRMPRLTHFVTKNRLAEKLR